MASKFAAPGDAASSISDRSEKAERQGPDGGVNPPVGDEARQLWNALHGAKAANTPSTLAHLEEDIFRYYLPWVRTLAQREQQWMANPVATEQAAELGLAQALLAWRHRISDGFISFAEVSIRSQLRRLESGIFAHAPENIDAVRNLGFASTQQ